MNFQESSLFFLLTKWWYVGFIFIVTRTRLSFSDRGPISGVFFELSWKCALKEEVGTYVIKLSKPNGSTFSVVIWVHWRNVHVSHVEKLQQRLFPVPRDVWPCSGKEAIVSWKLNRLSRKLLGNLAKGEMPGFQLPPPLSLSLSNPSLPALFPSVCACVAYFIERRSLSPPTSLCKSD